MTDLKLLVNSLKSAGKTLATAESCTGGLIGKLITDTPGASEVYLGGFITYTNEIKINILGVSADTVAAYTEVSRETAIEMANRARILTGASFGVSTTGFAGPGGGTDENPVGTVYIGISTPENTIVIRLSAGSDKSREEIRNAAAETALNAILDLL